MMIETIDRQRFHSAIQKFHTSKCEIRLRLKLRRSEKLQSNTLAFLTKISPRNFARRRD